MGLYKQQYCGCIFSERDRFLNPPKSIRGNGLARK
jgi:predicted adenine nucleotide alpha hydrolase (AANH) superfamily ATPase